jgi:hypothetical protein
VLGGQLILPFGRKTVKADALAIVCGPAGRPQPACFFEMERGIQRARFNLEYFVRPAANSLRNCVAMARTPLPGLQDQHVECALKQLDPVLVWFFGLHARTYP